VQIKARNDNTQEIFASTVGGMQNSYFFMGLRSLKKIGVCLEALESEITNKNVIPH